MLPACDGRLYSFKYVNGHSKNTAKGLLTVTAFGVLADVESGYSLLLSEMTLNTALRTAATSVVAARWMARRDSRVMALIGNGAQSEFQAIAFYHLLGIRQLRLHDTDAAARGEARGESGQSGLSGSADCPVLLSRRSGSGRGYRHDGHCRQAQRYDPDAR